MRTSLTASTGYRGGCPTPALLRLGLVGCIFLRRQAAYPRLCDKVVPLSLQGDRALACFRAITEAA